MSTVRLKLREDAYYAQSPSGLHMLTHHGAYSLTGVSIGQWIDRLALFLDGQHSITELTAVLAPKRREFVEKIVTILLECGVVREVRDDEEHRLSTEELRSYRSEIGFIAYFRDSAERAFERYRQCSVLVVGAGQLLPEVVRASLRSGLLRVHAVITSECPTDQALLNGYAERAYQRDTAQRLERHIAGSGTADELATLLQVADLVVHISNRPMVSRAELLDQLCADCHIPLVQAMVAGNEVWLSSACRPHVDGPGWTDGWQRRTGLGGAHRRALPEGTADVMLAPPAAAVVANQVVQDMFRYLLTDVRSIPQLPRMARIQLDTLSTDWHRFLAHPFSLPNTAENEAESLARISELETGYQLSTEEFSRRAAALTDARLGIFGEISEQDFTQLPLHVTQTTVSDPVGLLGPNAPRPVVTGAAPDFATARYHVALRALETYCSLMIDPRRLIISDERNPPPSSSNPQETLKRLRSGELDAHVRAFALAGGQPQLLTVDRVFPALRNPTFPYTPPCGVVAAYSWSDALEAGLAQHCGRLTIAEAVGSESRFPLVDVRTVALDKTAEYCLAMLTAIRAPVTIIDITGALRVPTFACSLGGETTFYSCGLSIADALRDGLQKLLLCYQAQVNNEQEYAPVGASKVSTWQPAGHTRPVTSSRRLTQQTLVARLLRSGYIPAVIPLDHDQEVHRIMPYVVHVVVTDA